jgi:CheY-like chemotaxis protein/DNA-directed RNA polymerase specialized sigma24 family protein
MATIKDGAAEMLVPRLRRYARVLAGDAPTAALLAREATSAATAHAEVGDRGGTSFEMYRAVSRLWRSLGSRCHGTRAHLDDASAPEQRRIARMSSRAREAYLLTGMEGFTAREAAMVIDITEAEILDLIEQAKAETRPEDAARVVIIEDEFLIARDLEQIVVGLGHTVVGRARNRSAARELIPSCKPDLILADIQLADDSSGIDAVNEILQELGGLPVIFITAFPASLICAQRPAPTFLVGKPYDPTEVRSAIAQVLYFNAKSCLTPPVADGADGPPLVRFAG